MSCSVEGCTAAESKSGDVFCPEHWRALPKWARNELVALRNAAKRGNQAATRDFLRAAYAAARLTPSAPAAASGTPRPPAPPSTSP